MSSEFAPLPTVGRLRVQRFCRQLRDHGWQVRVLTLAPPPQHVIDPMLVSEIPGGVTVHRVRLPQVFDWPMAAMSRLLKRNRAASGTSRSKANSEGTPWSSILRARVGGAFDSAKRFCNRHLLVPDDTLPAVPGLIRTGHRLAREFGIDLILVSVPSFSFWLAANRIGRRARRPVVVDYRDLWSGDVLRQWVGPLRQRMETRLEKRLLSRAAGVVTVSRRKSEFVQRLMPRDGSTPLLSLYNSSEIAVGAAVPIAHQGRAASAGRFDFVYTGRLYGHRRLDPLLHSLARLAGAGKISPHEVRIRVVGSIGDDEKCRLERVTSHQGLSGVIQFEGYVTHERALAAQREGDALIVIVDEGPTSDGVVPAKVAEYFAASRFVVAICGPGEVSELVEAYGFGIQLDPAVAPAFDEQLLGVISRFRRDPTYFSGGRGEDPHPLTDDGGLRLDGYLREVLAAHARSNQRITPSRQIPCGALEPT